MARKNRSLIDGYMTLAEGAQFAGVSVDTLRRWVVSRRVPGIEFGPTGRLFVRQVDLERLVRPVGVVPADGSPVVAERPDGRPALMA
jgi:hypothetical protein